MDPHACSESKRDCTTPWGKDPYNSSCAENRKSKWYHHYPVNGLFVHYKMTSTGNWLCLFVFLFLFCFVVHCMLKLPDSIFL